MKISYKHYKGAFHESYFKSFKAASIGLIYILKLGEIKKIPGMEVFMKFPDFGKLC